MATTTPDAIDLLTEPVDGNWPHEFEVRGRRYTMVPGGPSTHFDKGAIFRVWTATGRQVNVTIRPTDAVRLVSYEDGLGNVFPARPGPDRPRREEEAMIAGVNSI